MMFDCDPEFVESIRTASRSIVRELGFMQETLAATKYPPSAVHAIVEIGGRDSLTSSQLADLLYLEKSSVSRMVRKLIDAGELKEEISKEDCRAKFLTLTAKGRKTLAEIHAFGRMQVTTALARLPRGVQQIVGQGLGAYSRALETHRRGPSRPKSEEIQIRHGYQPGVIGRVVEMHARFYSRQVGFGQFFESLVAKGLAEFAPRLSNRQNGLWVAMCTDQIVGSVAIDGEDLGNNTAHLRWFIVDDGLRGVGVGQALLTDAIAFCDRQGFEEVHLWTFRGLDAARRLYERFRFVLTEERAGHQWGGEVTEQLFVRKRRETEDATERQGIA